jgi:hypothetical protein
VLGQFDWAARGNGLWPRRSTNIWLILSPEATALLLTGQIAAGPRQEFVKAAWSLRLIAISMLTFDAAVPLLGLLKVPPSRYTIGLASRRTLPALLNTDRPKEASWTLYAS